MATIFVKIKIIDLIHEFLETIQQQLAGNLYIPASNDTKLRKSIELVDSYFGVSTNVGAVYGQPYLVFSTWHCLVVFLILTIIAKSL